MYFIMDKVKMDKLTIDKVILAKKIYYSKIANEEILDPSFFDYKKEIAIALPGTVILSYAAFVGILSAIIFMLLILFSISTNDFNEGNVIMFVISMIFPLVYLFIYFQYKLGLIRHVSKMKNCPSHDKISFDSLEYCQNCKKIFGYQVK